MSCRTVRALLVQARDEPLPQLVRSAVDTHLTGCLACARLAVVEEGLGRDLAALRDEERRRELPSDFRRGVKERLLASGGAPALRPRAPRWTLAAAAALTIVAIGAAIRLGEGTVPPVVQAAAEPAPASAAVAASSPASGFEAAEADWRRAPLLYATPEVEVLYGGPGASGLRPVAAVQPAAEAEAEAAGRTREYHF